MAVEAEVLLPGAALQKRFGLAPAPESSRQTEKPSDGVTVGEDPPSCNHSAISWSSCFLTLPGSPAFHPFIALFPHSFLLFPF